jgi:hypothetical protein
MTNFSDLITYFENLSKKHISILHSEAEKHFFRFEIDEVLAGFNRMDINYPMLILEGYNFDFTDNKSDNLLKNRRGAFVLLDHVADITDYSEIHNQWDALEIIGDDILAKIKADKRNPLTPVVANFDFASIQANLIMNEIGNTVGIRYLFAITSPASTDVDELKWLEDEPAGSD